MDILGAIDHVDARTLQRMSYGELVQLEDELLLKNELQTALRIRFTAGRVVLLLLGLVLWGLFFFVAALLLKGVNEQLRGLLDAVAVFVTLGLAVYAAQRVWSAMGTGPRMFVRYALHYWPVLAVLGASAAVYFRRV
jgi:hypothetical protein